MSRQLRADMPPRHTDPPGWDPTSPGQARPPMLLRAGGDHSAAWLPGVAYFWALVVPAIPDVNVQLLIVASSTIDGSAQIAENHIDPAK